MSLSWSAGPLPLRTARWDRLKAKLGRLFRELEDEWDRRGDARAGLRPRGRTSGAGRPSGRARDAGGTWSGEDFRMSQANLKWFGDGTELVTG